MKKGILILFMATGAFSCSQQTPANDATATAAATSAAAAGTTYGASVSEAEVIPARRL